MIRENKHFIFDNEIGILKYMEKILFYYAVSPFYKLSLKMASDKVSEKKYYSSVCSIFKNEAPYLKEWIEYHRIVGFSHFYLYNNFSDDNYKEVLAPYIKDGIVTLTEWPVKQGQMEAYKECAEKYSSETNWISYIDLDEFVVPNTADDINCLLKNFENRPIVIAYWKLFGTSGYINRNRRGLVIEDFWQCWRKYTNVGKCFYNTAYDYASDMVDNFNMHSKWTKYKGRKLPPVNFYDKVILRGINIAKNDYPPVQINHYFTKSYSEYCEKQSRGDAVFEINPRDEKYFNWHEMKCISEDYHIRKYLIILKRSMNV